MQGYEGAGRAILRWLDQLRQGGVHRMHLAIQFLVPEIKKFAQRGKFRRAIKILPDIGLQNIGTIGQAAEDLRRGQPVVLQLFQQEHRAEPFLSLSQWCHAGMDGGKSEKNIIFQYIMTHPPKVLPDCLTLAATAPRSLALYTREC